MHHLNQSERWSGIYTYGKPEKARSAIDHILVNNKFMEQFKGIHTDRNKGELEISDYNLVKAWFNIGEEETSWKKKQDMKP